MPGPVTFWDELFPSEEGDRPSREVTVRVLRRHGRPFLLLPDSYRAAKAALQLYPAQTPKARAAKALTAFVMATPLRLTIEKAQLRLPAEQPLARFLCENAGTPTNSPLSIGVLAGNPAAAGRRFVILVFSSDQTPRRAVKVGLTPEARHLLVREREFLQSAAGREGIPLVRAALSDSRVEAFASDFFGGRSPREKDWGAVGTVLTSWLQRPERTTLDQVSTWKTLRRSSTGAEILRAIERRFEGRDLVPCVHHGDFAPWNIKISPVGEWRVLDWERGELRGIPGWDWFHYFLQTLILVEKRSTPYLVRRLEDFLRSPRFVEYSKAAAFEGRAQELLLAYLVHLVEVVRPSEGLEDNRRLLAALVELWRPDAARVD